MNRIAVAGVGVALVVSVIIALALDGPGGQATQQVGPAYGGDPVEIELYEPWVDGVITRAWALDPFPIVGDEIGHADELSPRVHLDVGGYDALIVYSVFPYCRVAPEVRAARWDDRISIDLKSTVECDAESIAFVQGVGLEFASDVDATLITATHEDP